MQVIAVVHCSFRRLAMREHIDCARTDIARAPCAITHFSAPPRATQRLSSRGLFLECTLATARTAVFGPAAIGRGHRRPNRCPTVPVSPIRHTARSESPPAAGSPNHHTPGQVGADRDVARRSDRPLRSWCPASGPGRGRRRRDPTWRDLR